MTKNPSSLYNTEGYAGKAILSTYLGFLFRVDLAGLLSAFEFSRASGKLSGVDKFVSDGSNVGGLDATGSCDGATG